MKSGRATTANSYVEIASPLKDSLILASPNSQNEQTSRFETERKRVDSASPLRRQQFLLGRNLIREAFSLLDLPIEEPILSLPDGRPSLEPPYLASVSHTTKYTAIVVGIGSCRSIGIDIETDEENFVREDWLRIASPSEYESFASQFGVTHSRAVNILFSIKEALYKCVSSILDGEDLDFREVHCMAEHGSLRVHGFADRERFGGLDPQVDWQFWDDHVLSIVHLS